jgi:hypothetical protein
MGNSFEEKLTTGITEKKREHGKSFGETKND